MTPIQYLQAIQPTGPWALGAIHPDDKRTAWLTTFDAGEAQAFIDEHAALGRNLYYQPNYAHPRLGRNRASKTTMVYASVVHVDLDPPISVTTPEELSAWQQTQRDRALALDPAPSVIVFSGSGYQLLWHLVEPVMLGVLASGTFHSMPSIVEQVEARNRGIATHFGEEGDDIATGVQSLLRLPGTWNYPNAAKRTKGRILPVLSEVVALDLSKRYTLDRFPASNKPVKLTTSAEPSVYGAASPELLEAARAALVKHGPAIVGQHGDQHTVALGALLLNDFALTFEEAWPLALEWNERNPGRKWSEDRLATKLHNGRTYASGTYGERRDMIDGQDGWSWVDMIDAVKAFCASLAMFNPEVAWDVAFKQALIDVKKIIGVTTESSIPKPLFEACGDFLQRKFPPTVWMVEELVKEGGTLIVGGEPKTAKSWILLELARAICTGTKAFGWYATGVPKRGAYFFAEDLGGDVQCHLHALVEGAKAQMPVEEQLALLRRNLHIEPRGRFLDLLKDEDLALIVASCRRFGQLGFVFCEPLRDIHSGEENSSDGMAPAMKRLRLLGELLQCTPGTAHHNKKGSEGRGGEKMRGSSALHGSVDSGIYLSGLDGNGQTVFTNTVESEVKGAKSAGTFKLTLTLEDDMSGRAVDARWARNVDTGMDDLEDKSELYAVLRAVFDLQARGEPTTSIGVQKKAKARASTISKVRNIAQKKGLLVDNYNGWGLTDAGRRFVTENAHQATMLDTSAVSIMDAVGIDRTD